MKRNNFSSLVKEEMVNRFESVVQEEIRTYKIHIQNTYKALDESNKIIQLLKEEIHQHKNATDQLFNKILDRFLQEKTESEIRVQSFCNDVSKKISELKQDVLDLSLSQDNFLSMSDYEHRRKEIQNCFDDQVNSIQANLESSKSYNEKIFQESKGKREEIETKHVHLHSHVIEETSNLEKKIQTFKVDSEGVLKELRIYKKGMFIIDKKIENIYTLIERLQKREDLCHSRE